MGMGAAVLSIGCFNTASCMTAADEVKNYVPGETSLDNPCINPTDPDEFCLDSSLVNAEARFKVYKERSFVRPWLETDRFSNKYMWKPDDSKKNFRD